MTTYYTYKSQVPLAPGQVLGFVSGRGYFAADKSSGAAARPQPVQPPAIGHLVGPASSPGRLVNPLPRLPTRSPESVSTPASVSDRVIVAPDPILRQPLASPTGAKPAAQKLREHVERLAPDDTAALALPTEQLLFAQRGLIHGLSRPTYVPERFGAQRDVSAGRLVRPSIEVVHRSTLEWRAAKVSSRAQHIVSPPTRIPPPLLDPGHAPLAPRAAFEGSIAGIWRNGPSEQHVVVPDRGLVREVIKESRITSHAPRLAAAKQKRKPARFNRAAELAYIKKYSGVREGRTSTRGYNPKYEVSRSTWGHTDDCTNFISQALHAGGWKENDDWSYTKVQYLWTPPFATKIGGASSAWENVRSFTSFAIDSGRAKFVPVKKAEKGDIIIVDFDGGKPGTAGFHGDHTMIVTGHTKDGNPLIASHGSNRYDFPLLGKSGPHSVQGIELKAGKHPTFMALHIVG